MSEKVQLILAIALGLSETLALVPSFKSSGIIDFVIQLLKKLTEKK